VVELLAEGGGRPPEGVIRALGRVAYQVVELAASDLRRGGQLAARRARRDEIGQAAVWLEAHAGLRDGVTAFVRRDQVTAQQPCGRGDGQQTRDGRQQVDALGQVVAARSGNTGACDDQRDTDRLFIELRTVPQAP